MLTWNPENKVGVHKEDKGLKEHLMGHMTVGDI